MSEKPEGAIVALTRSYFNPRLQLAAFAEVPAKERADAASRVRDSIASAEAAEGLWPLGHTEQALAAFRTSAILAREAAELVGAPANAARSALGELETSSGDRELDLLDHQRVLRRVHRALGPLTWTTDGEVRRVARERAFVVFGTLLLMVLVLFVVRRALRSPKITASANQGPAYLAAAAHDDDVATEWLLPDRASGFLELHLRPGRRVHQLELVNAFNAPYGDRGTDKFTVETFLDDEPVTTIAMQFPDRPNATLTVDLGNKKIDRVKVTVNSWLRLGGGLAEARLK